jgi:hypothetical protein
VRDRDQLDRDTLSTIAEVTEVVNERGYRTLRVKQHDRLAPLTLLARISVMLINRQEISGPGGEPVEVGHHAASIRSWLEAIAKRS